MTVPQKITGFIQILFVSNKDTFENVFYEWKSSLNFTSNVTNRPTMGFGVQPIIS